MLKNGLQSSFSCNLLHFVYYITVICKRSYKQNEGDITMKHFQTSFFYDPQKLIRNALLIRKYYLIFKDLDLSAF